jgi:tetratricopeptide (TPR) repeat protein
MPSIEEFPNMFDDGDPGAESSDSKQETKEKDIAPSFDQQPEAEPEPEPEEPSIAPLEDEEAAEVLEMANAAKAKGNEHFKLGKWAWACDHYSEALDISEPGAGTPTIVAARAVYISNRAQCRIKMELFEQAVADCTEALKLSPDNVKALLRRAKAYELMETPKMIEAVDDLKRVAELEPTPAHKREVARAEKSKEEQFEKQKEEMMGTLKNFGNKILGNFGLSTDNFQMTPQDGGGYSVNFVQNQDLNKGG